MNYLVLVILFVISSNVMGAADSKHIVSFGQGGLGGNWSYEKMETERNSPYADVNFSLGNLSLNYSYRLGSRVQVGGFYESTHTKYRFKQSDGNEFAKGGVCGIYNFSKKINESYNKGEIL